MIKDVGVEKVFWLEMTGPSGDLRMGCSCFPLGCLSGCSGGRTRRLAQEPYQSFDVLRCRREEELFADELHTAQAKPSHSDLILQLREQRFHLLAGPLRNLKRRRLG